MRQPRIHVVLLSPAACLRGWFNFAQRNHGALRFGNNFVSDYQNISWQQFHPLRVNGAQKLLRYRLATSDVALKAHWNQAQLPGGVHAGIAAASLSEMFHVRASCCALVLPGAESR